LIINISIIIDINNINHYQLLV